MRFYLFGNSTPRLFFVLFCLWLINYKIEAQPSGSLDPSFGSAGVSIVPLNTISEEGMSVASLSNDHVLVGGFVSPTYTTANFALMKFKSNGSLDSSFGTNGIVTTYVEDRSKAQTLAVQNNDKILLAGYSKWFINIVRYQNSGELDSSFGSNGKLIDDIEGYYNDRCNAILVQANGKILILGYAQHNSNDMPYFLLARYLSDGSRDSTFGNNGVAIGIVGIANTGGIQSDGSILISGRANGQFTTMRYTPSGRVDSTFGTNGVTQTQVGNLSESLAIQKQDDGKIVVAGYSDSEVSLVRYHSDGSIDLGFGLNGIHTGTLGRAESLQIAGDGKILVAGSTSTTAGVGRGSNSEFQLFRFNANGTLDNSFGLGGRVSTSIGLHAKGSSLALQKDGKILFAGSSSDSCGTSFTVARYFGDSPLSLPPNGTQYPARVFPNPIKDLAEVQFDAPQEWIEIMLYNLQGQLVLRFRKESTHKIPFNTETLDNGPYLLHVRSDKHPWQSFKIILQ